MEQKDKELLLKDLCARLPHGVHIWTNDKKHLKLWSVEPDENDVYWVNGVYEVDEVKPYLRPLSSMTEEEKFELKQEHVKDQQLFAEVIVVLNNTEMRGKVIPHFAADWCDKNMFDYRGLIPAGLALSTETFNPYVEN